LREDILDVLETKPPYSLSAASGDGQKSSTTKRCESCKVLHLLSFSGLGFVTKGWVITTVILPSLPQADQRTGDTIQPGQVSFERLI